MDFLKEIFFGAKKEPAVVVIGDGRFSAAKIMRRIISGSDVKIFESDLSGKNKLNEAMLLLRNSRLPVLAATHFGEIAQDEIICKGEKSSSARNLAGSLPKESFLIFNFDDESARELKNKISGKVLSFGLGEGADFRASDINVDAKGTNFKIINDGKTIPFWLDGLFGKEQIYSALAAVCVGKIIGLNLVEMSQSLKS